MIKTCTALLFLIISLSSFAATVSGHVIRVSDGDTIVVMDSTNTQYKVRLSGIDAPEKKQPYGQESKQALYDDVYQKAVTVQYRKKDRYGRIVGKVINDGEDVNIKQLRRGLAWHYKKYEAEQEDNDRGEYAEAERIAKSSSVGLWKDHEPTAPWDFRHKVAH